MPRLSQRTFDRYKDALEVGHRRYEAEAKPIAEQMIAYFKGDQWAGPGLQQPGALPQVTANLIFADVKVMIPVLALRNPRIFAKPIGATQQRPVPTPRGPEMRPVEIINGIPVSILDVARAQEGLINWRWRQLRLVKQVRRVLIDSLLNPFGIMKIGYELATEKVDLQPTDDGPAEMLEVNELITADAPFAVRWSPADFRVDPESRYPDLSDAGWIAFGWKARVGDLKRNPRFMNTRNLKGTVDLKRDWDTKAKPSAADRPKGGADEDEAQVQCWEIWNKRTQMRMVVADEHDKALEFVEWPQQYKGFPAETLVFTEHPDCLYGPPDLKQVLGQQDAYNQLNSIILNHVRRYSLRKLMTTRGAFDEKEMEKLGLPIDGLILEADGNLKDSVMAVPDAPLPVDTWQTRANFREDHDRISGVADFVRGVAEKVDTATEAAALQANLNVRTNDTRAIVEDFAERVSKKLLAIDSQTLDIPKAIPVLGPDGAVALGQYIQIKNREMLLAESDIEIELGSMQPINDSIRKRDALELFTLLRNDPLVDQFKLHSMLVPAYREHIPDVESLFLTRDQFEMLQARQMQMANGLGQKPGGLPGSPAGPAGGAPRPAGPVPPRPAARPPAPRPAPRPAAMAGAGGGSGPRPVPGPTDQEV